MEFEHNKPENTPPNRGPMQTVISIPGIGRLMDPTYGKKKKTVWLITILICSVACAYLTTNRLLHFFDDPIATEVSVVSWQNVTFPAFTICSTNLLYGYRTALKLKAIDQCIILGFNNCSDKSVEKMSFQELNISVMDVWEHNMFRDVELTLSGSPLIQREYFKSNTGSSKYSMLLQNNIFGCCMYFRLNISIRYFSSATRLQMTIWEKGINLKDNFSYIFIPHGMHEDSQTTYEYLSKEFEILQAGYDIELKLKPIEYNVKNRSTEICFDEIEENNRLKHCVYETIRNNCRVPYNLYGVKECEFISEIWEPDSHQLYNVLEYFLGERCAWQRVCKQRKHRVLIDHSHHGQESNKTSIVIKMADSIDIVQEIFAYTFPMLVSDLFAYWSFFLCLSALVFIEIFECICKALFSCFRTLLK